MAMVVKAACWAVTRALVAGVLACAVGCRESNKKPTSREPSKSVTNEAKALAKRLGRSHFLIGMGNDLARDHDHDGTYTLGVTLDLHDAYLVGLRGQNGWPDWIPGGTFVNVLADTAKRHGVVPMFTLYSLAARNENNLSVLTDDKYMKAYWDGAKLLFQRLAVFDSPAIVHLEPDFWAFAQQAARNPAGLRVHVKSLAPDCSTQPDNLVGMGRCLVRLCRKYAPQVLLGFHASVWAGSGSRTATYLSRLGAADADLIVVDMLDRDAGCFEAHVDPNCQRSDGPWYWDETNQTKPNFHEHLAWAKTIAHGLGKPVLWWQLPFGVPSARRGGSAFHYRDNRVRYLFGHVHEFVAAGGVGAVFGVGAANQTYITTDGNQFKNAVTKYFAAPAPL
jgi:hypothetical protein